MALAIFDLDNTLISDDSDHLWGEFMATHGLVDAESFRQGNDYFYQEYVKGTLDLYQHLAFCLEPLTRYTMAELNSWRARFMDEIIHPVMLPKGHELIKQHQEQRDHTMIITATNRFVTEPIAKAFGVDTLLAIDLEVVDNQYTGRITGPPTYQEGKVTRLKKWLLDHPEHSLDGSTFYSDSKNDLPLLEAVTHAVAVDPDEVLKNTAKERGWRTISLR